MKKWAFLLLFLPSLCRGESFSVKDLSGGLYTNASANKIPDNAATIIENFYTDVETLGIERNGSEKRDTTILGDTKPVTGLWEFVDNTGQQWIISFSSKTFYKNQIGIAPSTFGARPTVTTIPDCAPNLGKLWCVNGTDSMWYFDGAATATVAGAPLGTLIEAWRNRLIIGNISGSQSTLRVSGEASGTDWTLGGQSTSPFSIAVGGANDGFNITSLWKSYQDNFVVGRKKDLWYLSGFDQGDWELRNISAEIGCIQQGSMREFDGSLLFLSSRGMEELRGYTITHISEPIRNITDIIVKNTAGSRSNTQTTQADFGAGSISPSGFLSTTSLVDSVVPSSFSKTETSNADFTAGTHSNTEVNNSSVRLSTTNQPLFNSNNGWSFDTSGTGSYWTFAGACGGSAFDRTGASSILDTCGGAAEERSGNAYLFGSDTNLPGSTNLILSMHDAATGAILYSTTYTYTAVCTYTQQTFTPGISFARKSVYLRWTMNAGCSQSRSYPFIYGGGDMTFYLIRDKSFGASSFWIDDIGGGYSVSTGVYTSQGYDMTRSTNLVMISSIGATINQFAAPKITLQTSSNGSSWVELGQNVLSTNTYTGRRYARYIASFTVVEASSQTASTTLDDVSLVSVSTGGFTSQIVDTGGLISAWGPVTISDQKQGGTIDYQFNSSSNTSISLFLSTGWLPIVSGGIYSGDVKRYFAFRATFSATVGTAAVSLDEFKTSWSEGAGTPPIVSWNYDRRYWLAYTTSALSSAYNDRILVYQRNRTWTLLTGINAASFATWRDALYFGNSISNGYVYKFDVGNSDDGAEIISRIVSKSYDLGYFSKPKDLQSLYVTFFGNAATFSGSFSVSYDLDRSGASYNLGSANLTEGTGQVAAKFPFSLSNPVQGREIQYKITKSGAGDRLKLYELGTIFNFMEEE